MKNSAAIIIEKDTEKIVAKTNIESFNKDKFDKECQQGMSVEEFRQAALEHINSLPWKK